jgi:hypothetical protein
VLNGGSGNGELVDKDWITKSINSLARYFSGYTKGQLILFSNT